MESSCDQWLFPYPLTSWRRRTMWTESFVLQYHRTIPSQLHCDSTPTTLNQQQPVCVFPRTTSTSIPTLRTRTCRTTRLIVSASSSSSSSLFNNPQPLDLTEDNVREVLADARQELAQLFDQSVGMTGEVDLAELDGPFVKISLKGRFWHKRSTVVERLGNYLKQRIPEILEVDIEDEKQLDDSPASF